MTDPMSAFLTLGNSLSTAVSIAKALSSAHVQAEINTKAIELQGAILDLQNSAFAAQAEHAAALSTISQLEAKIAEVEAWEETQKQYKLEEVAPGVFAYAFKPESNSTEPAHRICANCYQKRVRSILQRKAQGDGFEVVICHACRTEITFKFRDPKPIRYGPNGGPGSWMGA